MSLTKLVVVEVKVVVLQPLHFIFIVVANNLLVAAAVAFTVFWCGTAWPLLALAFLRRPEVNNTKFEQPKKEDMQA